MEASVLSCAASFPAFVTEAVLRLDDTGELALLVAIVLVGIEGTDGLVPTVVWVTGGAIDIDDEVL